MNHELLTKELLSLNSKRDVLKEKNIRYQEQLKAVNQQILDCENSLLEMGVNPNNVEEYLDNLEKEIIKEKSEMEKTISDLEREYSAIDDKLKELRLYN